MILAQEVIPAQDVIPAQEVSTAVACVPIMSKAMGSSLSTAKGIYVNMYIFVCVYTHRYRAFVACGASMFSPVKLEAYY